jgi:hypothetical protein
VNLYGKTPVKTGRVRDAQASLQLDVPLGKLDKKGAAVFTLAAYYQYQIENGILKIAGNPVAPNTSITLPLNATVLLTPKGGIFIAQAKLTFRAAQGQAKIPVAITWSNRTELIKAPEIRGNIGIQFDWDTLFGSSSGSASGSGK